MKKIKVKKRTKILLFIGGGVFLLGIILFFWSGLYESFPYNYFNPTHRAFKTSCEELNGKPFTIENINTLKEETRTTVFIRHHPLDNEPDEPGFQDNRTYREKLILNFIKEAQSGKVPADNWQYGKEKPYVLSLNTGYIDSWGCNLYYIEKGKTAYIKSDSFFIPWDD